MIRHPLSTTPEYLDLVEKYVSDGSVRVNFYGDLKQFTYNDIYAWTKGWDKILEISRGIIFDSKNRLVALPFPKFYSFGQHDCSFEGLPNLPYKAYPKWDGSLIICYYCKYLKMFRFATKGSLKSEQAQAADELFRYSGGINYPLDKNITYLFEYIAPTNQIVVRYPEPRLVLLGGYRLDTFEEIDPDVEYTRLKETYPSGPIDSVATREMTIQDAINIAKTSTCGKTEGFVIRFDNGYRVKVKTEHYVALHRIVTNLTPKRIHEAMIDRSKKELESAGILHRTKDDIMVCNQHNGNHATNTLSLLLPEEHREYVNIVESDINARTDKTFAETIALYDRIREQLGTEFTQKQFALAALEGSRITNNNSSYLFMLNKGFSRKLIRHKVLENTLPKEN